MRRTFSILLALIGVLTITEIASSQVSPGTPPFGSFGGGPFDTINLGNLNVHFVVPILNKAGRGVPFNYELAYDNSMWYPVTSGGSTVWTPVNNWGWQGLGPIFAPYVSYSMTTFNGFCGSMGTTPYSQWNFSNFVYHDVNGTSHYFGSGGAYIQSPGGTFCPPNGQQPSTIAPVTAPDGSGYTLKNMSLGAGTVSATLTAADGSTIGAAFLTSPPVSPSPFTTTDRNGNQITASNAVYTDTLGTTVLTATGTPPSNTLFTYTPPSGTNVSYTVSYHTYTVTTAFNCSGVTEYNQAGKSLVDRVTLPDGSYYQFTYESTFSGSTSVSGRLASVRLPTGGTITYAYSGGTGAGTNPINCADGSTATLTRTLSPGGQWTYARSFISGTHWQTTTTDPTASLNQSVIDFQQAGSNFYETQGVTYQGSSTSGTRLGTTITCYNAASPTPVNCPTTAVTQPISRRIVFTYLADPTDPQALQTKTDSQYFSSLADYPSQVDSYAYGVGTVGALLRSVVTAYGTFGNAVLPTSVTVKDGGAATKAFTTYSYDQVAVTATSGTPNHISVAGARGNLTTSSTKVSGSVTLYERFTYYDTGNLQTSTDVGTTTSGGPNSTTYNYAAGTASCGNSFATSVSKPMSLSRSMVWDCIGGVTTSATDENGKTNSMTFSDLYFWRPASSTDPLTNVTNYSYPSVTVTATDFMFNSGNSVVGGRITLDAMGRPIVAQKLQGPGVTNYDSVETDYDIAGRVSKVTRPYSATASTLCSGTCPGSSTTFDAFGRVVTSTDGGGGILTSSYTKNNVLQTAAPAPAGENTKRKQYEYDALGRIVSVCEVTNGTASGSCGQTVNQTGYWTKYTYDTLGNLSGVTQNAQAMPAAQQTRTYLFDMVGRVTSETNPESGSIALAYDELNADASCGTVISAGDLLKRTDAVGNVTCYRYDALHRVTSITYPTGGYSTNTHKKFFVYDSATVNGTAMSNAKTRLAEAYTCTGACSSKITDLGYSYSARGEVTDIWQSTPHSGGYYHVTDTYWANGVLNTLSGIPGVPTITYGVDSKGRAKTVSASSGQNPVTNTTYNVAGEVTAVTFGSLDNDAFTFDANTGRMTQYKFNVGTVPQSLIANLTSNANGTLRTIAITDQLNAANTQTCNSIYDDLVRIASVNCGAVWAQTFSLDPFGNLSKSGSANFLPTYASPPTNRYSAIPGGTVTYDANGNLTNDVGHSYTWDSEGKMLSVDGSTVTMVYDAKGRMAEQTRGSTFTQILYSPNGKKIALLNGMTLVKAYVALPSGAKAVYTSAGLSHYRHADNLGSSRLATTPSRTVYSGTAYAPYGENYSATGTQDLSFTAQEQDTVGGGWSTGLYDFQFREYRPAHGRWISPDPAGRRAVNPSNPQSWNRYAYVLNNPQSLVDPLGLEGEDYDRKQAAWAAQVARLNATGSSHSGAGSLADAMAGSVGAASRGGFLGAGSVLNNPLDSDMYSPFEIAQVEESPEENAAEEAIEERDREREALIPEDPEADGLRSRVFDWMNPGPLPDDIAATFAGGRYVEVVVGPDGWEFDDARVWGGAAGVFGKRGTYYSPTPQVGGIQSMMDLGLPPGDPFLGTPPPNTAENTVCVYLAPGTTVYVGPIAAQGGFRVGGGVQIFVPPSHP